MQQDKSLTALEWLEKYYYNNPIPHKENPEARAAFFRMSLGEMERLGSTLILDSVLKRTEIEAENKRNGTYTAQDTINRLQDEVAFLYIQWAQSQKFVTTLRKALARYGENIPPEEMDEIRGQTIYLRRLGHITQEQIGNRWVDQDLWPRFELKNQEEFKEFLNSQSDKEFWENFRWL